MKDYLHPRYHPSGSCDASHSDERGLKQVVREISDVSTGPIRTDCAVNYGVLSCTGYTGCVVDIQTKEGWLISRVWMSFSNTTPLLWCIQALNKDEATVSDYNENLQALLGSRFPSIAPARSQCLPSPPLTSSLLIFTVPLSSTPKALFLSAYLGPPRHLLNLNHSSDRERGDPGQRRWRNGGMMGL